MILVLLIWLITIIVFTCVCFHLFIRLGDAEGRIALLGGWIVEEPEPPKEEQPRPIDIFRMQKLISSLNCKNITPLYPWQQSELNQILGPYGIREEMIK